ncbi:AAC(3) family N-acetyltransferase [Candidatus Micrarchaeota archaeon]|nr:AAC(3) family N-acetyltransferase [Candidatus Micrarchaeota archaeon]
MAEPDYSYGEIVDALRAVGISAGNDIFIHSNIGFFGKLEEVASPLDHYNIFKKAIFSVIGKDGTLIVPTFSYSFCKGEFFDPKNTKSVCGFFSEMVRMDPEAQRSNDANFSIAAIGKKASYFAEDPPEHSFGPGSFWDKFLKVQGKICNFNFDSGSTFIHYVEKTLKVPYRYDKAFPGTMLINGNKINCQFYHFVYDLDKPNNGPNFTKFDRITKDRSIARIAKLGKGTILSISAQDCFDLVKAELAKDPALLIKGTKIE